MVFCAEIVNGKNPLTTFARNSILDVWLGCEYAYEICVDNNNFVRGNNKTYICVNLTIEIHNKKVETALHKKWSFPLRISSVSVTKSAVSCIFDHIYWRNLMENFTFCAVRDFDLFLFSEFFWKDSG